MSRSSPLPRLISLLCLLLAGWDPPAVRAGNFVCSDPEIVRVAEQARIRSAEFWTGAPLPGNWSRPCPITVHRTDRPGSGSTTFSFENGEVFNWRMALSGDRESLLRDVIPHEVDHMVRASLVRRPIERWLDEGCAALLESEQAKQRLRRIAHDVDPRRIDEHWISGTAYPRDERELARLYALGFSLVEFLLQRDGAGRLLEFQRDSGSVADRLHAHYGLTVETLRDHWSTWREGGTEDKEDKEDRGDKGDRGDQTNPPVPSFPPSPRPEQSEPTDGPSRSHRPPLCNCRDPRPDLLVIWTASWCGPCRNFWEDWHRDAEFRAALTSRFHIHVADLDRHHAFARQRGITTVPTFDWQGGRTAGYRDKQDLLRRLGISVSDPEPAGTPADNAEPVSDDREDGVEPPPPGSEPKTPDAPPRDDEPETVSERSFVSSGSRQWARFLPAGLTVLQWAGLIGGSAATGGIGGIAVSVLWSRWNRRNRRPPLPPTTTGGREAPPSIPFPRQLDEARQLLGLRQSEGRVAILDALRGMFLDDELDKLTRSDPSSKAIMHRLREAIDQRVDEVAPLSTLTPQPSTETQPCPLETPAKNSSVVPL
jgi:hypothetical protein